MKTFDDILFSTLGEFGRWQKWQLLLVCFPTIFTAMHALGWTFAATPIRHRCRLPFEDETFTKYGAESLLHSNDTRVSNILNGSNCTVPVTCTAGQKCGSDSCSFQECAIIDGEICRYGYVYDHSAVRNSAVNKWDIVCNWRPLKAIIQASYYIGQMVGSMTLGYLGDRIGRKGVFIISIFTQVVCGVSMALAPYWWLYMILRFGVGFSHPGVFLIAVVIGMELVGPTKRRLASVITGIFFALGQVILGSVAYLERDFQWLQFIIAAPAVVFFIYYWIVPESPRWLVSQKRFIEADVILRKAAQCNKVVMPRRWWDELEPMKSDGCHKAKNEKRYGVRDLFRTPEIRRRSMATFFLWPVVSMIYYGVSMKTDFLGGDFYLTFIIGGLMEIPALLLVYLLIDRVGRKPLLASGYFIAAVCLVSNVSIPKHIIDAHLWLAVGQFLLTKASITCCYALLYTVTPELYPTVIRNTAAGCCSTIARIGAMVASVIAMYLVDVMGPWSMVIPFGILSLLAGLTVLCFIPETMGRVLPDTIEECEVNLTGKSSVPVANVGDNGHEQETSSFNKSESSKAVSNDEKSAVDIAEQRYSKNQPTEEKESSHASSTDSAQKKRT